MDSEVADRRFDARFDPPAVPELRATVRPGCAVKLVDVSAGGALVQAPRPMRPGARVHLQVTAGSQRLAIPAQVLRCSVWSLHPEHGVTYRGALIFDERVEWHGAELAGRPQVLTNVISGDRSRSSV
jgi:hypothetical protein